VRDGMGNGMSGWILGVILAAVTSLVLGLTLVWLNIERMDIAYGLQKLQAELDSESAHTAKLELERENLITPYRLRRLADELQMRPAVPGQIRRMDEWRQPGGE